MRFRGLQTLAAAACAAVLGAQPGSEPVLDADVLRLAKIKVLMEENLLRLPDYTCQQTVERSVRRKQKGRFELVDALRLEVALVDGKELFSWPGQKSFDDRELSDLVGGGTIGNGTFGLHARSVFLSNAPTFRYAGQTTLAGTAVLRYDFQVPQFRSGYRIKVGDQKAVVGYYGSFFVSSSNLELLRLEIEADEIPPYLGLSSAGDAIDYGRVRIGENDFLLPVSSVLTMVDVHGVESRNRSFFSHCRQYTGESVLTFAEPSPQEDRPLPSEPISLPEGLLLELHLQTPILPAQAARGDQVTAVVGRNVKHNGMVLIPKGALAHGRFLGSQRQAGRVPSIAFHLEFTEVSYDGKTVNLAAVLEDCGPVALPGTRTAVGKPAAAPARTSLAGAAPVIVMQGSRLDLQRGFRMIWRTIPMRNGERQ